MLIGTLKIRLYAPWVHSLKEKRMIVKSLSAKIRNQFNVSVAEIEDQDIHQSIVLGIACIAGDTAHGHSILDHVIAFVERSTEANIVEITREMQ